MSVYSKASNKSKSSNKTNKSNKLNESKTSNFSVAPSDFQNLFSKGSIIELEIETLCTIWQYKDLDGKYYNYSDLACILINIQH